MMRTLFPWTRPFKVTVESTDADDDPEDPYRCEISQRPNGMWFHQEWPDGDNHELHADDTLAEVLQALADGWKVTVTT